MDANAFSPSSQLLYRGGEIEQIKLFNIDVPISKLQAEFTQLHQSEPCCDLVRRMPDDMAMPSLYP